MLSRKKFTLSAFIIAHNFCFLATTLRNCRRPKGSSTEDLLPYRGTFEPSTMLSSVSAGDTSKGAPTMPSLQFSKETVDTILDDEFVTSRDGGFRRFLVKWHGRPDSDATWIHEDDLRHLDSSLLDCYISFHFSESSSFQPGGNDGEWSRPLYRPKRDRKPKSNEDFYYY